MWMMAIPSHRLFDSFAAQPKLRAQLAVRVIKIPVPAPGRAAFLQVFQEFFRFQASYRFCLPSQWSSNLPTINFNILIYINI
jgi:hypothetical protein